jgi:hypothetical protein
MYLLDGAEHKKLKDAIISGFSASAFAMVLEFKLRKKFDAIAVRGTYEYQVFELINTAYQEGWLIDLCSALADERVNAPVYSTLVEIRDYLVSFAARLNLTAILSYAGTDVALKSTFKPKFFGPMAPCDIVDTPDRLMESRDADAMASLQREIENAPLFVALISKRYVLYPQPQTEIGWAIDLFKNHPGKVKANHRLLAVFVDPEGLTWFEKHKPGLEGPIGSGHVVLEAIFDETDRQPVAENTATQKVIALSKSLRARFDADGFGDLPEPEEPSRDPPPGDRIIVLGEPKGTAVQPVAAAINSLVADLGTRSAPVDKWDDGWRERSREINTLTGRPIFVRVTAEPKLGLQKASDTLAADLNVSFGFPYDEQTAKNKPLWDAPRVLWRPDGPDWDAGEAVPGIYSSAVRPPEFSRWLADILGLDPADSGAAIVHYEDPTDFEDPDNAPRREILEETLVRALTYEKRPDSVAFGSGQLPEVIDRIGGNALTVIAVHDLATQPGSEKDTLLRYQKIDDSIDQALARNRVERPSLMRVAVLFRNARLFPQLTFNRNSRVKNWRILRCFKAEGGRYQPDAENLKSLRTYAAELIRGRAAS